MNDVLDRKNTRWFIAATSVFVVLFLFLAPFNRGMYMGYEITFERPFLLL